MRWLLAVTCVVALTASAGLVTADQHDGRNDTAEDWPTYLGDNRNSGVSAAPAPGANATVVWTRSFGPAAVSSPAVVGETIFLTTLDGGYGNVQDRVATGETGSGYVLALNATTGATRWNVTGPGAMWASPVHANGTVYVATLSGDVVALDAVNGSERWTFHAGHPVFNGPTYHRGRLYFGTRDADAHELSHRRYPVYALDATDGSVVWRSGVEEGVFGAPAVANGTVYFGDQNGTLYALAAATGDPRWRFEAGGNRTSTDPPTRAGAFAASPTVFDGRVYAGRYDGAVVAVSSATGSPLWNTTLSGRVASSPAVTEESVFIGTYNGYVYSLDRTDGTVRWRSSTGDSITKSSPAVADGRVYVGGRDGTLHALSAETGRTVWQLRTGERVLSSPAVSSGRVHITDFDRLVTVAGGAGTPVSEWRPTQPSGQSSTATMASAGDATTTVTAQSALTMPDTKTPTATDSSTGRVTGALPMPVAVVAVVVALIATYIRRQ